MKKSFKQANDSEPYSRWKRNKCMNRILKLSCGVNLCLLFAMIVLFLYRKMNSEIWIVRDSDGSNLRDELSFPKMDTTNDEQASNIVCLDCTQLGSDVKSKETLYSSVTDTKCGRRICCIENDESIKSLLHMMMANSDLKTKNDTDLIKTSFLWWRDRKQAAHLYLDQAHHQTLRWRDNDESGVAFSNLELVQNNSKIQILERGIYFVYTAVTFNFRDVKRIPIVGYSLFKSIFFRPAPEEIVEGRYGGLPNSDNIYTGFLSASVKLDRKSEISLHISDTRYISLNRYSTYLGIFKLE